MHKSVFCSFQWVSVSFEKANNTKARIQDEFYSVNPSKYLP